MQIYLMVHKMQIYLGVHKTVSVAKKLKVENLSDLCAYGI